MQKLLTALTLWLFFAFSAQGQSEQKEQVEAAVETLRQAIIDGNRAALEKITASELSYGHSTGLIEDKEAFVEALASGTSDFETMELTDQSIKIADDVAIVRHKLSAKVIDQGESKSVRLGVLLIWQKNQRQWKLLARQAYKL